MAHGYYAIAGAMQGNRSAAPDSAAGDTGAAVARAIEPAASPEISELALARLMREFSGAYHPEISRPRAFALLMALRPEATRIALLTLICASAINALVGRVPGARCRTLLKFYPSGTSRLMLASARYRRLEPDSDVARALEIFDEQLATGVERTLAFAGSGWSPAMLDATSADGLVRGWREAAASAARLLASIDAALWTFNVVDRADENDVLVRSLAEAAAGGIPLIRPDGSYVMPEWAEQRRSPRVTVECAGALLVDGTSLPIRIQNISSGGAGIETTEELAVGQRVVIVIDQSIVLPGTVVWATPPRSGIEFESPLLDDSPAYRFLTTQAAPEPR